MTGPADEGLALAIFIGPRTLADEHEPRAGIADSEDHVRAPLAEPAAAAVADDLVAQPGERRRRVGHLDEFVDALRIRRQVFGGEQRRQGAPGHGGARRGGRTGARRFSGRLGALAGLATRGEEPLAAGAAESALRVVGASSAPRSR